MKQPKLYTKNEKGRYEEYQIPDMDVSETLFRRINGKYYRCHSASQLACEHFERKEE